MEGQELLTLSLVELGELFITSIPAGFLIGSIPMTIGVAIHGLINIFKKA